MILPLWVLAVYRQKFPSLLMQIKALEPSVYIYCQNPLIVDLSILEPLQVWGGETRHVENLGRESHAFLLHILHYYHELPEVVLFSQDIPDEGLMEKRIEVSSAVPRILAFSQNNAIVAER